MTKPLCPVCWSAGRSLWIGCCFCTGDVKREQLIAEVVAVKAAPAPVEKIKTREPTKKAALSQARYEAAMNLKKQHNGT